ncbi:MAG TPA: NAD(+)/NADH kinase [Polyangia bacterium]|nr:NAD(+)/NADH kinase [Polyangia bacterium]
MRRVGLILKRGKPEAIDIAAELAPWLTARGWEVAVLGDPGVPAMDGARLVDERELGASSDLLVVLGGDGTLLRGAQYVADRGVPILGVNLGHLGFLTSCNPADARRALELAFDGKLTLEDRLRLRCQITRSNGEKLERFACNDAVVSQGALARLIEIEALLDGARITRYRADGLIVATPTGSTAYNLAAGGPIVTPDVDAVVVTPICPHTLSNRPVVAPASSRIVVRLASAASHVMVTIDGQWGTELGPDDVLEISRASPPLKLYRPEGSYFDVLTSKLRWGDGEG